jgi:proteasome lid subunit RPN8/RPN11
MSSAAGAGRALGKQRMAGRIRSVELPLLRGLPDPANYCEHVAPDGRRVFLFRDVLRDLAELELSEHPIETAGLLFGAHLSDGLHTCTVVNKVFTPRPGEVLGTHSSVTITPDGAERMIARARREDPVLMPVGWGHTHPCFQAYFSDVDRAEQRNWRHAGSVGLVLSGLQDARPRYRVFVGPESTLAGRLSHPAVAPPEFSDGGTGLASESDSPPLLAPVDERPQSRRVGSPRRRTHVWTRLGRIGRRGRRARPARAARAGDGRRMRHRRDTTRRPVIVTRAVAYVIVGGVIVSLALSAYAIRVAADARRQAREASHVAAALRDPIRTGATVGQIAGEPLGDSPGELLWPVR